MKRIHVAVGIIINRQQQILLAKRHEHLHQGGKWEFPGGKVEIGETISQALIRELKEEVDLDVESTESFMDISHNYPDKHVLLDIHLVKEFKGEGKGLEGQIIQWVNSEELGSFDFPEANLPILEKIRQLDL
ncbi:8-oxo-dGTP diphosphatase MutT [Shewanella electrodiphila]|uniref:8-oxo-dGTP diphosphatase n=1 Tax=Shewanella electrodiphila TaxID=934143 RepID=A0ABT0KR35_9GAMM|nr:8-oxo-dGTP diphosphatase MutT [Shewanella electrodiphila]MCL1046317.1 8-oxo-dGTP diphosphatase MutT [Shewanella electrodiphila]